MYIIIRMQQYATRQSSVIPPPSDNIEPTPISPSPKMLGSQRIKNQSARPPNTFILFSTQMPTIPMMTGRIERMKLVMQIKIKITKAKASDW